MNIKSKPLKALSMLFALSSCSVMYTMQDISTAALLTNGMSKEAVSEIMGLPARSEFNRNLEEWHYCKTAQGVFSSTDEFVALFFNEGTLFATRNYAVSIADTKGATGDCTRFIKQGNYREPDVVAEFRNR